MTKGASLTDIILKISVIPAVRHAVPNPKGLQAKAGYEYVMKWSKVSQLREYMDGDTSSRSSVYNSNILIMFVGNKAAEKKGEEEYFFPYPFVGRDESAVNSNVLVVAKV